jgi:O-antigen/teichoic acid export membrane protein
MELRKKVILNAGSNWASQLVMAVVALVLVPVIRGTLGKESFGVWFLLSTGLRYPMILESSFSLTTNRFVAFYRNNTEQMNRFVSASFAVLTILAALTIAAAIILSFFISDIFSAITANFAFDAKVTCILVGATLAFRIVEASFSGTLMGLQYHTRTNSIVGIVNILRAVFTVIVLIFWKSIIAVQFVFALSAAISLATSFIVAKKSIPCLKINILKVNREVIRELFRYTGHAAARSGSMIFMYSTVTLLLGKFGTPDQLDIYAVASLASGFVRSLLTGMQNVFLPVVTTLYADGQVEKMKNVVTKGTHISSALTCITTILLYIYAANLLALWIDNSVPAMIFVFRILIITEVARGFFGIWLPSLVGMGHLHALSTMSIVTSAGAIFLELILFKYSVYVPIAAAIALLAATWAYLGLWMPIYGSYKTGLSIVNYFKKSLFGPLSAAAISIAVLRLLNFAVPAGSINWFLMFIISGIIVCVIFFAIALRSEAKEILAVLKKNIR